MSDLELVAALKAAVRRERENLVDVIRCLMVFDERRLHAPAGQPSLYHYCTRELGYAEEAAFKRIRVARAADKYPILIRWLTKGRLHLGAVVALSSRLTRDNHRELLKTAMGKSIREIEFLSASIAPRPDKADHVRVMTPAESLAIETIPPPPIEAELVLPPAPSGAAPASVPAERAMIVPAKRDDVDPLSAERVRIAFTASRRLWRMLTRARELLRARHPDGKFEYVFEDALAALLREIDPLIRANRRPKPASPDAVSETRYIPRSVKDAVWRRDGGRCTFTTPDGERCPADGRLELDHIVPWALGGRSDDPGNLRLRCRAHNLMTARQVFGGKVPG